MYCDGSLEGRPPYRLPWQELLSCEFLVTAAGLVHSACTQETVNNSQLTPAGSGLRVMIDIEVASVGYGGVTVLLPGWVIWKLFGLHLTKSTLGSESVSARSIML